jgi:hypothetical protein
MTFPSNFGKVQFMALYRPQLSCFHTRKYLERAKISRDAAVRRVARLLKPFPNLEEIDLVMDGIHSESCKCGEWVDAMVATRLNRGCITNGRTMLRPRSFEPLAEAIRQRDLNIRIPRLRLKLLVGSQSPNTLWHWNFYRGSCWAEKMATSSEDVDHMLQYKGDTESELEQE